MKLYAFFIKKSYLSHDFPLKDRLSFNKVLVGLNDKKFSVVNVGNNDATLYAITDNKEFFKFFKDSRNMEYFETSIVDITKNDYKKFVSSICVNIMLDIYNLCSNNNSEKVIMTQEEYEVVTDEMSYIEIGTSLNINSLIPSDIDLFNSKIKKSLSVLGVIQLSIILDSFKGANNSDFHMCDDFYESLINEFDNNLKKNQYCVFIYLFRDILRKE